jgi:hypothetical protein
VCLCLCLCGLPHTRRTRARTSHPSTGTFSKHLVSSPPDFVGFYSQKYRIVEVDSNKSVFVAIFTLHLRWQDFSLTDEAFEAHKTWQSKWTPDWTPRLDFVNETGAQLAERGRVCGVWGGFSVMGWWERGGVRVCTCVCAWTFVCVTGA